MKFQHPCHQHPLGICENILDAKVACQVCGDLIEADSAIGCEDCSHYMHFSCCKLQHPLHPQHPLIPMQGFHLCPICNGASMLSHICSDDSCHFGLCNHCISQRPPWKFELEGHLFFLVYSTNMPGTCHNCGEHSRTVMFMCMSPGCKDCFHVQCVPFPLPQSINHPNHWHPLTFTESFVDPDIIGCYCDACEEERDPEIPVYRCEGCNFTSDVTCALTQVPPSLVAEWESNARRSGQMNPPGDRRHVRELKQKLARLRGQEHHLMWQLERTTEDLNKADERHARYVEGTCSEYTAAAMRSGEA